MTTYPSGTVSLWGSKQAIKNQDTWISYVGVDGSIFYLAGPLAPIPGAQNGLALQKHMGLMAPLELLELRGARQDGATWTDSLYGVGEIMLNVNASGLTPQDIRDVIRHWIGAWSAKQTGKLCIFTPDMGEWWAPVRQSKHISDVFTKDYTWSGKQDFIWSCKNYNAFWYGPDSVSTFSNNTIQWITTSNGSNSLAGSFVLSLNGIASSAINAFAAPHTLRDAVQALSNVGAGNVIVSEVSRGLWGVTYALEFVGGLANTLIAPLAANISRLFGIVGVERVAVPQSGFVPLTNIGDQPAWPRYLCYGPGTFTIGNGPGASNSIVFGPLAAGQIVLITTEPRLRSVVDLSPNLPPQALNVYQSFIQGLISYATNNNVPPLLQQFESIFGILPPQGNLYALLNGRFTNPIPAATYGVAPEPYFIPVNIYGGDANSKVIAAITPMRQWPL